MGLYTFRAIKIERLEPDSEKVGDIFSRLGYAFEDAIADVVDNALDAEATKIHIRFVTSGGNVHSVIIANNGKGMNDEQLKEAMRFGSRSEKTALDLGKYGIGLKSASLSQADTVIVLSNKDGKHFGRRWTIENVKNNWTSELLDELELKIYFDSSYGEFNLEKSGTLVIWQRLAHLQALPESLEGILTKTIQITRNELGIRFHRFLESGKLAISLDKHEIEEKPTNVPLYVLALNPFPKENITGVFGYPIKFRVNLNGININVECHIWPSKSNTPGYKLGGGKVSSRQGFYFYRNERIIQAGGWNGLIADDSEPHLSLARVKIDLPSQLDSLFKLDVTKSHIYPPPNFLNILNSISSQGKSFEHYLSQAREAYRSTVEIQPTFPNIPGNGFSSTIQKKIALLLKDANYDYQKISFKWDYLNEDEVFKLDTKTHCIFLNIKHKRKLVEGGGDDAPILKLLLLFLCEDKLGMTLPSDKTKNWLQKINLSILTALGE